MTADTLEKRLVVIILSAVLLGSLAWHLANRNTHFQECDSALSYRVIADYPQSDLSNYSNRFTGGILSENTAEAIIHNPIAAKLIATYGARLSPNEILQRLMSDPPLALARLGFITLLTRIPLPHFLVGFFALPLGSTYSAGPGLIYGLMSTHATSYTAFMSRGMFLLIILFHLCIILLYLIARRLGASRWAAALAALLMLFSISMYSYAYHLGSTMWNIIAEFVWLYVVVRTWGKKYSQKAVSIATAILIFFNYLLVIFWITYLAMSAVEKRWLGEKKIGSLAWSIARSQIWAIVGIVICMAVFYPPGQGGFITVTSGHFLSDTYYIILNFFSIYNHNTTLTALQFILAAALVLGIAFELVKVLQHKKEISVLNFLRGITLFIFLIYFALAALRILGFAPSRHILFLAPLLFIFAAIVLDKLVSLIPLARRPIVMVSVFAIIIACGIISVAQRTVDTFNYMDLMPLPIAPDDQVITLDCSVGQLYNNGNTTISLEFKNAALFIPGAPYVYLDRATSFANAYPRFDFQQSFNVTTTILQNFTIATLPPVVFPAYDPPSGDANNEPNNVYLTKFVVTSVTKK